MSTPKPFVSDEQIEVMASPYERSPGATRAFITGSKATRSLYEPHVQQLVRERDEAIAVLTEFWNERTGSSKPCGHDYDCICTTDRVRSFLRSTTPNTPPSNG